MNMDLSGTLSGAFGGIGGGITGGLSVIGRVLPALIVGGLLGFMLWKVVENVVLYKHQIKLKKIVGKNFQWYEDRAMEKRLKNGSKVWMLKKLKIKISIPPDNILMTNKKGLLVAEGYLLNDNQIVWGRDSTDFSKIKEEVETIKTKIAQKIPLLPEEEELMAFDMNFQPVTTNDRIILADAMEASEFGKKDFHKLIEKAIPWIVIIMLFVLFIFGFKYYAGPLNDMAKEAVNTVKPVAQLNQQTAALLVEWKSDAQVMKTDLDFIKSELEKQGKEEDGK